MSKENADRVMQVALDAGMTNHKELANFMGQMQVESGNFERFEENLHYKPEHLLANFPDRNGMRTLDQARDIVAGGSQAIGNELYGGEWGKKRLGNTEPGDGYTYRGRGFTQLTGRDNYRTTGSHLNLDLVNHPDDAAKPDNAARIAVDFWDAAVVKRGAQNDVAWTSRIINGGTNGLTEREAAAATWERKLDAGYRPGQPDPTEERATADRRELQAGLNALGYTDARGRPLAVDGQDGPGTRAATEAFQREQNLAPDGIAGSRTRTALAAALADAQAAPTAAASPPSPAGSTARSTTTSPSSAAAPVPASSSPVPAATTTPAATGEAATAPTAAELWSAVAARAPTAALATPPVVTVSTGGPALTPR